MQNRGLLVALAALAAGVAAPAVSFAERAPIQVGNIAPVFRPSRRQLMCQSGQRPRWNYHGEPITVAKAKRRARKARNVKRNRLAHRGRP